MVRNRRLLTFAGIIGFFQAIAKWDDVLVSSKLTKLLQEIEDRIIEVLKLYRITETEANTLHKKIADIEFGCFERNELTQKYKSRTVTITQDTLDTITEHAINYSCLDCKRNISACSLRKAMKKANIECYEQDGKCEYMIKSK